MDWAIDAVELVPSVIRRALRNARRRLSSVEVTASGVRVRNFPGRHRRLGPGRVSRFDWRHEEDDTVGIVVIADGTEMVVWALDPNHPGRVTELNNALLKTRV